MGENFRKLLEDRFHRENFH